MYEIAREKVKPRHIGSKETKQQQRQRLKEYRRTRKIQYGPLRGLWMTKIEDKIKKYIQKNTVNESDIGHGPWSIMWSRDGQNRIKL